MARRRTCQASLRRSSNSLTSFLEDSFRAALQVIDTVEGLGVPCFLGGSLASTIYGIPRSTLDADIVADLESEHAAPLVEALGDAFYADLDAIQEAIRDRSSFNVIHLATAFKVDVFIPKQRPFDRIQFERAIAQRVDPESEQTAMVLIRRLFSRHILPRGSTRASMS